MRYTIDYHTDVYFRHLQEKQKFVGAGETINKAVGDCIKRFGSFMETYDWANAAVKFLDSLELPFADKPAAPGFMYGVIVYFDTNDFRDAYDRATYDDQFNVLS